MIGELIHIVMTLYVHVVLPEFSYSPTDCSSRLNKTTKNGGNGLKHGPCTARSVKHAYQPSITNVSLAKARRHKLKKSVHAFAFEVKLNH